MKHAFCCLMGDITVTLLPLHIVRAYEVERRQSKYPTTVNRKSKNLSCYPRWPQDYILEKY